MPVAKLCRVTGRVQGVFYRASTQAQARKLGVTGYAKNLTDGSVEVLAVGSAAQVDVLVQWLWQGSPTSAVAQIEAADVDVAGLRELPSDFFTA